MEPQVSPLNILDRIADEVIETINSIRHEVRHEVRSIRSLGQEIQTALIDSYAAFENFLDTSFCSTPTHLALRVAGREVALGVIRGEAAELADGTSIERLFVLTPTKLIGVWYRPGQLRQRVIPLTDLLRLEMVPSVAGHIELTAIGRTEDPTRQARMKIGNVPKDAADAFYQTYLAAGQPTPPRI